MCWGETKHLREVECLSWAFEKNLFLFSSEIMQHGSSLTSSQLLKILTKGNTSRLSADALLNFFQPLKAWLEQQNRDEVIGWNSNIEDISLFKPLINGAFSSLTTTNFFLLISFCFFIVFDFLRINVWIETETKRSRIYFHSSKKILKKATDAWWFMKNSIFSSGFSSGNTTHGVNDELCKRQSGAQKCSYIVCTSARDCIKLSASEVTL